jgi:hypothetical protein
MVSVSLALPFAALLQSAVVDKPVEDVSKLAEFYLVMRECVKVQGWLEPAGGSITTETRTFAPEVSRCTRSGIEVSCIRLSITDGRVTEAPWYTKRYVSHAYNLVPSSESPSLRLVSTSQGDHRLTIDGRNRTVLSVDTSDFLGGLVADVCRGETATAGEAHKALESGGAAKATATKGHKAASRQERKKMTP